MASTIDKEGHFAYTMGGRTGGITQAVLFR